MIGMEWTRGSALSQAARAPGELAARLSMWNRARKMRLFLETMRPDAETRVIDVGVTDTAFGSEPGVAGTHNFFEAMYPWPERITAVSDRDLSRFQQAFPQVSCIVADRQDLPFPDDEFDVAFSNAVVEHVGDRRAQREFVHKAVRVAPRIFVSTPNRWFPIEPHTLVPFAHWLPRGPRERVFSALRRSKWKGVELLSPRAFLSLFPASVGAHAVDVGMTTTVVPSGRSVLQQGLGPDLVHAGITAGELVRITVQRHRRAGRFRIRVDDAEPPHPASWANFDWWGWNMYSPFSWNSSSRMPAPLGRG